MTNRHRGLTEQAADAAVDSACRMLRLPTIRSGLRPLIDLCRHHRAAFHPIEDDGAGVQPCSAELRTPRNTQWHRHPQAQRRAGGRAAAST